MRHMIVILGAALLLAGMPSLAEAQRSGEPSAAPSPGAADAAAGASAFGLDVYRSLAPRDGNLFISPVSAADVLAMAYAGAAGDTAAAFEGTLKIPLKGEKLLSGWSDLRRSLAAAAGEGAELSLAGSLWPDSSAKLKPAFLRSAERSFDSAVIPQEFAKGGEAPRLAINEWAERETKGRVKDLITAPLPTDTRLVLAAAVYFKGEWKESFDRAETKPGSFRAPSKRVKADFMRRTGPFGYLEDGLGQVLEIPYRGKRLSMFVLLPKPGKGGMAALEASLAGELLGPRLDGAAVLRVDASLPRFSFSWGTESLREVLAGLGLSRAFGGEADFSGMTGDRSVKISDVLHRAFVDVTEEGTEAAAASAAVVTRALPPSRPKAFKADRPFVFLIMDRDTGAILFLGRLDDPSAP